MTPECAEQMGTVTFVVNPDDCQPLDGLSYRQGVYPEGEVFNLTHHAGHREVFVKRKGARKDPLRMRAAVLAALIDIERDATAAQQHANDARHKMKVLIARIDAGEEVDIVL